VEGRKLKLGFLQKDLKLDLKRDSTSLEGMFAHKRCVILVHKL
jgi:hypothetical protein